ncbi:MAG: phosphate signaling complex protein PhoU [Chitinophagaceae bacterium]|nr:phosphate signaling complex protein PhoU [Chitinophagaceae bacterium]
MTHLEQVLSDLKAELQEMAVLVQSQLKKSRSALMDLDKTLAKEVLHNEKRVNAMELKIDKMCENIVALYNPVANDMRTVFAYFKINSHLERMGDYAKNIAYNVIELPEPYSKGLMEKLELEKMFHIANEMINENVVALMTSNPSSAHEVFEMDTQLNLMHNKGIDIIVEEIKANTDKTRSLLELASIVRRLERVGDYNTNIAEEIIFCFEALVLKHKNTGTSND